MFFDVMAEVIGNRPNLGFVRPEHFDGNSDYLVTFWWLLNNDEQRPHKYSKRLSIVVSQDAVEDFRDAPQAVQEAALGRLRTHLQRRLAAYDPDHNAPRGAEEPTERWEVSSADFIVN